MRILTLDLGTTTGWAHADGDFPIASGTVSFKPGRYEGGGMRFLRFRRWLSEVCDPAPDAVYFEEVRSHKGTDAAHVYGGFLGQLTAYCEAHEIPYQGVSVGTIKKHVTGSGNANKEAVIKAVADLGYITKDDNEADAVALMMWAREAA